MVSACIWEHLQALPPSLRSLVITINDRHSHEFLDHGTTALSPHSLLPVIRQEIGKQQTSSFQFKLPPPTSKYYVSSSRQFLFTLYIFHTCWGGWPNHSKSPYVTILCNMRFMVSPPPFPGLASCRKGPQYGAQSVSTHPFTAPYWFSTMHGLVFVIIPFKNKDNLVYQTPCSHVFVALEMMHVYGIF